MSADEKSHPANQEVTVVGLVHPLGSGGAGTAGELWRILFRFYAWRGADGTLHRTQLRLEQVVTRERLDDLMQRIQELAMISARVRFLNDESAELLELLSFDDHMDDDLERIAAELRQPLLYQHPRFGTFTFDRALNYWEATVDWVGSSVRLILPGDENSAPDDGLLKTALELWDNQQLWKQRIDDYAVQKLLPTTWLEDDETPLTPDDFKARIALKSIIIFDEGGFEFVFKDGDLFGGHSIRIYGNLHTGPSDASL